MREKPLILITDDEANFREIISTKLKAAGFDCVLAKNAKEAIAKSAELLPDLILLDIRMPPGQTGIEAALAIQDNPATKDVKIAFLTNQKDPWPGMSGSRKDVSAELGFQDFLDKDQDLNLLEARVREILEGIPRPPTPPAPGTAA